MTTYQCGPGFGSRGQTAYNLRQDGLSWQDIANKLEPPSLHRKGGDAASAVMNGAKKYAKSQNLPWPVTVAKVPKAPAPVKAAPTVSRQERAYQLRTQGRAWAEVAGLAGYKNTAHAVTAASKHAARANLAWPIRVS